MVSTTNKKSPYLAARAYALNVREHRNAIGGFSGSAGGGQEVEVTERYQNIIVFEYNI